MVCSMIMVDENGASVGWYSVSRDDKNQLSYCYSSKCFGISQLKRCFSSVFGVIHLFKMICTFNISFVRLLFVPEWR